MRKLIAGLMLVGGAVLVVASYFFLAAPWGFPPRGVEFSDPLMPFAPLLFVLGGIIMWLAAVVFEIMPVKRHE